MQIKAYNHRYGNGFVAYP